MKHIEMKTEGYTFRYDFPCRPVLDGGYFPERVVSTEDMSDASFALRVCLDLLRCCYGAEAVREALSGLHDVDF